MGEHRMEGKYLLWRMAGQPTFELNVGEAITRYRMRFGVMPTMVTANAADVPAGCTEVDGVMVMVDKETLIKHLCVGMAKK